MGLSALYSAGLGKDRIEALTDGIFATVMTILVLALAIPPVGSNLSVTLAGQVPNILIYIISFVVLGAYWVGHHNQFHYIRRTNRVFLWINILFLLSIGIIPYSTNLLGHFASDQLAVVVYGSNMIAVGLLLASIWRYATTRRRLVDSDLKQNVVTTAMHRILLGPAVYLVAILLSFVDTQGSLLLFAIVPVYYIIPGRIDILTHRQASQHPENKP